MDSKDFLLQLKVSQHFWSTERDDEYEPDLADDTDDPDSNPTPTVAPGDMTHYTFTVTVYYTKQAKAMAPKEGIIKLVEELITTTNLGYSASDVPLTLKLHCLRTITETLPARAGLQILQFF